MKSVAQKFRASGPESGISGRLSISGRLIFDTPKSMFFIENVSNSAYGNFNRERTRVSSSQPFDFILLKIGVCFLDHCQDQLARLPAR